MAIYQPIGGVTLIKFTVKPNPYVPLPAPIEFPIIEYIAEEGMTFEDFVNSKYNVDGWTLYNVYADIYKVQNQFGEYISSLDTGSSINADTVIDNDGVYDWYS